ncbi:hypothetical protein ACFFRR_011656 [Megaselia abdita]
MHPEIVVFGSAIVDFISYVDRLPRSGETLHGSKFATGFGGKGANQCVAAAKLGAKTAMVAKLGSDPWGQKYLENLKNQGVEISGVKVVEDTTGIAQIIVSETGENQIVIVAGANNHLEEDDVDKNPGLFKSCKVLITQLETPLKGTIHALKTFQGTSILNAAPALENYSKELLVYSKIFCVNEHEATIMSGIEVKSPRDAKSAIKKFLTLGANIVVITLGELGAVYGQKDSQEMVHIPVFRKVEKVVDTTGAGDAFIGSLAYFLVKSPESSLTNLIGAACEVASHSVQKPGTQSSFPNAKDLNLDEISRKDYPYHLL